MNDKKELSVAKNDPDVKPKPPEPGTMDRYRAGNSSNYLSYAIGAVIVGGMLYVFFGGDVSDQTTSCLPTILSQV